LSPTGKIPKLFSDNQTVISFEIFILYTHACNGCNKCNIACNGCDKCNITYDASNKCDITCNIPSLNNRDTAPVLYIYNLSSKRVFAL